MAFIMFRLGFILGTAFVWAMVMWKQPNSDASSTMIDAVCLASLLVVGTGGLDKLFEKKNQQ